MICSRLECEYPGIEGYCRATAPAAEGSSCGDGLVRILLYFILNISTFLINNYYRKDFKKYIYCKNIITEIIIAK